MGRILIVDDDAQIRDVLGRVLRREGYEVLTAATGAEALKLVDRTSPDVLFLDIHLPGSDGLEVTKSLRDRRASLCVVLMTGYGTPITAIRAAQLEVFEYLNKPLDLQQVRALARGALQEAARRARAQPRATETRCAPERPMGFVGNSAAMQEVYRAIGHISNTPNDVTVLVQGESGTGKELAARAIHDHGRYAKEPFVAINCTALPENLIESELFGFEKGAFTGADTSHHGKLQWARSGTVFLDEIGDLPTSFQPKLLRLLQERQFERLGSHESLPVKARFIAATNHDLFADTERGIFRADLFFRLNGLAIHMPPLREHPADIPELVERFLGRSCERLGRGPQQLAPEALVLLCSYSYPGNVRELANIVEKSVALCTSVCIGAEHLPPEVRGVRARGVPVSEAAATVSAPLSEVRRAVIDDFEARYVRGLLEAARGNVSDAARQAGMSRQALHRLMQRHAIDAAAFR